MEKGKNSTDNLSVILEEEKKEVDCPSSTQQEQEDRPRKLTEKLDNQFCAIAINNAKRCKLPYWFSIVGCDLGLETAVAVLPSFFNGLILPGSAWPTVRATTEFGRRLGKERRRYLLSIHNGRPADTYATVHESVGYTLMFTSAERRTPRSRRRSACVRTYVTYDRVIT